MAAVPRVINYVCNTDRVFDNRGNSFIVTHNLKGQTPAEWFAEIKANETLRIHKRKNNNVLTMDILSFHRRDNVHLSIRKLEKIAREYIRLRGNGMFIAVPHFDKQYHIHILAAGVGYKTGRSFGMSRAELSKIKGDLQAFQQEQFPELSHSFVRHGRKKAAKVSEKEYQYKRRTGKQSDREQVREIIRAIFDQSKTEQEFLAHLKADGMQPYERGGRITGVIRSGVKYRLKRLGVDPEKVCLKKKESQREQDLRISRKAEDKNIRERYE